MHGKDRTKAPEEVLLYIIDDIRKRRRDEAGNKDDKILATEDEREEKELRGYVIQSLATSIGNMLPSEENKHQSEREVTAAWRQAHPREGR